LETGCSNLFWIDRDICWVPAFDLPYLKGVFLQAILPHFPWSIQWIKGTFDQIPTTANMYICNALTHVRPVIEIDHCHFARNQEREQILQKAISAALLS
jgi:branched-subunit amino acid aminotransferase/4-amino-4-deoxychorismate lyase